MALEVLFCDNHLLAVVKPAMLPTQPAQPGEPSLEESAKEWLRKETGKEGAIFLHPIHRLDKAVSGIVLFARSSKALSRLNEAMREKRINKTYYALIDGTLPAEEGELVHYLKHGDFRAEVVAGEKQGGKKAILTYKLLETRRDRTLLEINLLTGRYHQIRAQFSAVGCPIVGDRKYGSSSNFAHSGVALHHGQMSFSHPVSKELITFTSSPIF